MGDIGLLLAHGPLMVAIRPLLVRLFRYRHAVTRRYATQR
jgi:hypothetical protein